MNSLLAVKQLGQHIWLDNLSRTLLREGGLARYIEEDGVDGVTSNPAIFYKALSDSPYYREELALLKAGGLSAEARYESLLIADVRDACELLACVHRDSAGEAGYVSLEVSPHLADDEDGSVAAARRLRAAVGRENLLLKVPATAAGIRAFERLTAEGINVNVTLMFSLRHYEAVAQAYLRGATRWLKSGGEPRRLKSVASIFLSRVDTLVDKQLAALGSGDALALRGKAAVAMAKLVHERYRALFHGEPFAALMSAGVRPQYPLWASTGTKNPNYSDLLYVEPLIGAESINTLPDATLAALRDHGKPLMTLDSNLDEAWETVRNLKALGIDLDDTGDELQVEGTRLFIEAYDKLLTLVGS